MLCTCSSQGEPLPIIHGGNYDITVVNVIIRRLCDLENNYGFVFRLKYGGEGSISVFLLRLYRIIWLDTIDMSSPNITHHIISLASIFGYSQTHLPGRGSRTVGV